jgi:predicted nucleic acid-binding protein
MTVVSDASPLHYLVLIEAEHVLAQLFSKVVAPPAVLRELAREINRFITRHGGRYTPRHEETRLSPAYHRQEK